MSEVFLGQIMLFAGNFAPSHFTLCAGQLLPIQQNTALFSLLGTMYGGDGKVTFGLPNLQGAAAVCYGQGPGTSDYVQGETTGSTDVSLLQNQMPVHNHSFVAVTDPGTTTQPSNNMLATGAGGSSKSGTYAATLYSSNVAQATTSLAPSAITIAGSGLPHNNMQPYLSIAMCMAVQGVFPSRG